MATTTLERLRKLLVGSDKEVAELIQKEVLASDYKVYTDDKNFVFCVPNADTCLPVCLCAHLDTRRTEADEPVVLASLNGTVFNANGVLGADDRAGIGIVLDTADRFAVKPYLLFTNGEERGFTGMAAFVKSGLFVEHLPNINLTVSVDRRGHNNFVHYMSRLPVQLEDLLVQHGYAETYGSRSDGKLLWEAYSIANVNVSAGYSYEHTANEFLLLESYFSASARLARFIQAVDKQYMVYDRTVTVSSTKQIVCSPSSNQGTGTASYTSTYTPFPPVIPTPVEGVVRAPVPRCAVCGRNDRVTRYDYLSHAHICGVCEKKVIALRGNVTPEAIKYVSAELEKARAVSREANRNLNKTAPAIEHPSCPVCKDNRNVVWSNLDCGFVCTACADAHKNPTSEKQRAYNGKFWWDKDTKVFKFDDLVYTFDRNNTKVLAASPLSNGPLTKCACCGEYVLNAATMEVGTKVRKIVKVCRACSREVMHHLLENVVPTKGVDTPPWDN